jgi:glycerol-3-phosphate dehydrogenase
MLSSAVHDLVIVGGGIFGICAAWDAVQRGRSVALIERGDFAAPASANCFKMVHGGVRYLQHGDVRRMRASNRELNTLLRIAPHLVEPLPIVIPTRGWGIKSKWLLRLGLKIYELITFDRNRGISDPARCLPRASAVSRSEILEDVALCQAGLVLFGENTELATNLSYGKRSLFVDHSGEHGIDGVLTVIGVRCTTARSVAARAVDRVFAKLGRRLPPSKTGLIPVYGGAIDRVADLLARAIREGRPGLSDGTLRALVRNHGTAYTDTWARTRTGANHWAHRRPSRRRSSMPSLTRWPRSFQTSSSEEPISGVETVPSRGASRSVPI